MKFILLFGFTLSVFTALATEQIASLIINKEILIIRDKNPNKVLLVGLDGGIKNHYPVKTFTLEQMFSDIDLMPMRRAEID